MNAVFEKKLPIPMEVKEMYPMSAEMTQIWEKRNCELKSIFAGQENKLILIIGPCSADNEESVLDYLERLVGVSVEIDMKMLLCYTFR